MTYWKMMLLAFGTNGLAVFGFRVLADYDLIGNYKHVYLLIWYGIACLLAWAVFLLRGRELLYREIVIAGVMGLSSVVGLLSMGSALGGKLPGLVVFPVAVGGNLFLVAAFGIICLKERVGRYGYSGIILGIVALVILSLP